MKIAVLGAGAVGLSVAARLSQVCDVHAVARKRHADAITTSGFHMTGIWGNRTYHFACSEDLPDESFDYIIITSKSTDTRSICMQFRDALSGRNVVSLQNGIGNEEIIEEFTDAVIGGMIITGFEWKGEGQVHVSVEAGPIKLGRFPEGMDDDVMRLVNIFQDAGMRVEGSTKIRGELWGKTLYNCALNPLGAIIGVPYGTLAQPNAWKIIEAIVSEAFLVCTAEGVQLPWRTPLEYLTYLRDVQLPATAGHHSSMLQDLQLGRRTEIDFINGAVVAKGQSHNIPTPTNAVLVNLIKFREMLEQPKTGD